MPNNVAEALLYVAVAAMIGGLIWVLGRLVGGGRETGAGVLVMRHTRRTHGVAALALVLATLSGVGWLTGALRVQQGADTREALAICASLFGFLGMMLAIECGVKRVTVDSNGVVVRGWFGTSELVHWEDVLTIENRPSMQDRVIRTSDRKVAVGHTLDGQDDFTAMCERYAPNAVRRGRVS